MYSVIIVSVTMLMRLIYLWHTVANVLFACYVFTNRCERNGDGRLSTLKIENGWYRWVTMKSLLNENEISRTRANLILKGKDIESLTSIERYVLFRVKVPTIEVLCWNDVSKIQSLWFLLYNGVVLNHFSLIFLILFCNYCEEYINNTYPVIIPFELSDNNNWPAKNYEMCMWARDRSHPLMIYMCYV